MKVLNYSRREASWLTGLSANSRDEAFKILLESLCDADFLQVNPGYSRESLLEAIQDREAQRTTAMGDMIAFPHARLPGLSQALFVMGVFKEPVYFEELPVRIVCLILVPAEEPTISLKLMAQFSKMLMDEANRLAVFDAKTPAELRAVFQQYNPRIDKLLVARDIMRSPRWSIREDDRMSLCAQMMSVNNLHAVPVVNEQKEVLGEITVDRLFRYGLPDFFSNLKSVSFIAEFDPFEKYFEDERNMQAGEIMDPDAQTVPMDYTIMEIVFDLAIKQYTKLYVVDAANRWVGTIDKGIVLDSVINH